MCSQAGDVGLLRQWDYGGGLEAEWDSRLCEGFSEDPSQVFCTIPQYLAWHSFRTSRLPRVDGPQSAPHLVFFQGEGAAAVGCVLQLWLQYLGYHGHKAGEKDIQFLRQLQVTFRISEVDHPVSQSS